MQYSEVIDIMGSNPSMQSLKKNLLKFFGVENHPKAELCFQQSWKQASGQGYYQVILDFRERVELLK